MPPEKNRLFYLTWFIAVLATAGSLYFSNVLNLPPCVLCWYQRIMMYPLAVILAVGIIRKDKHAAYYGLPLAVIGLLISVYHNLLYYKILPESAIPCTTGISCTTKQIEWLGFITIPLLSLVSFAALTVLLWLNTKANHNQ